MEQYWVQAIFKGSQVWVKSDEHGEPIVQKGYLDVRYGEHSPKIYRGLMVNLGDVRKSTVRKVDVPDLEVPNGTPNGSGAPADGNGRSSPAGGAPVAAKVTTTKAVKKVAPKKATAAPKDTVAPKAARKDGIILYTDGACSGNPGPAGLGVVFEDGQRKRELSGYLGVATNNIAELDAIRRGLRMVRDRTRPVDLYTDSSYAIGVLTKNWKAKANTDLVAEIRELLEDFTNIRFHWVRGHAGHDGNERADELARLAIERRETHDSEP